jgi:hypothetical protein
VSTTPAANFASDTGSKFLAGVNDTSGKLPNKINKTFMIENFFHLPPVSTTPVVHLELRISPRIFEKI